MNINLNEKLYQTLLPMIDGAANLVDIWLATSYNELNEDLGDQITFEQRREVFLWLLHRLLHERRIQLTKDDIALHDHPDKLVQKFRDSWPESIKQSGYTDFYWWFFDSSCPALGVWIDEI